MRIQVRSLKKLTHKKADPPNDYAPHPQVI